MRMITKSRHKWQCSAVVEQQTREGEVVNSNPAGHVSREFSAKNAATSMETGGRWPVAASLKKFVIIFGFFRIFILPSLYLCRVLFRHSAKALPSARHAALGKEAFVVKGYADSSLPSAALGRMQHSAKALPSAITLGKSRVCCSGSFHR